MTQLLEDWKKKAKERILSIKTIDRLDGNGMETIIRQQVLNEIDTTIEQVWTACTEEVRKAVWAGIKYGEACIDRLDGTITKEQFEAIAYRLASLDPDKTSFPHPED